MITVDDALYWERKYGVGYAFNRVLDFLPTDPVPDSEPQDCPDCGWSRGHASYCKSPENLRDYVAKHVVGDVVKAKNDVSLALVETIWSSQSPLAIDRATAEKLANFLLERFEIRTIPVRPDDD